MQVVNGYSGVQTPVIQCLFPLVWGVKFMSNNGQFEIPESLRQVAEQNVEQARKMYDQFSQMVMNVQEMTQPANDAFSGNSHVIQARALEFARENVDSGFDLAADLAKARDLGEYFEIQTSYAQQQMQVYNRQAEELGRLMGEAVQTMRSK